MALTTVTTLGSRTLASKILPRALPAVWVDRPELRLASTMSVPGAL